MNIAGIFRRAAMICVAAVGASKILFPYGTNFSA
jgi:hypothetical protein